MLQYFSAAVPYPTYFPATSATFDDFQFVRVNLGEEPDVRDCTAGKYGKSHDAVVPFIWLHHAQYATPPLEFPPPVFPTRARAHFHPCDINFPPNDGGYLRSRLA